MQVPLTQRLGGGQHSPGTCPPIPATTVVPSGHLQGPGVPKGGQSVASVICFVVSFLHLVFSLFPHFLTTHDFTRALPTLRHVSHLAISQAYTHVPLSHLKQG